MYRRLVTVVAALALAGCSLSNRSLGLSDSTTTASTKSQTRRPSTAGLGGDPSAPRQTPVPGTKVAALATDRAPTGSYDRAPAGALSDRDYSKTALNPEAARDIINAYRRQNGLKPVQLDAKLSNAAKNHSRDLSKWDRISHYGSDGSNPWDRVKRTGYNARLAAENVGTGQATFEEVMKGWQESPGHNKNLLLADAEHIGIALITEPGTEFKSFWTLVLASPL